MIMDIVISMTTLTSSFLLRTPPFPRESGLPVESLFGPFVASAFFSFILFSFFEIRYYQALYAAQNRGAETDASGQACESSCIPPR